MDDWVCNFCGANVFCSRLECFKCGQERHNNPILSSDSESDDEDERSILSSNPPPKNTEEASKKFHLIDEEFLRFNRSECFPTTFYEESKSMTNLRKYDGPGRTKRLSNKPVLKHSPIEMLPIVYDTTFYHHTDGNILAITPPWWFNYVYKGALCFSCKEISSYKRDMRNYVYKVTEGGNRIHLPCEHCKSCNAIFDTEQGALCFSCTEKSHIEEISSYKRDMRNYNNDLRKLSLPKARTSKKQKKAVASERKKYSLYPKKFKHSLCELEDEDLFLSETTSRETVLFCQAKPERRVSNQCIPPYWYENDSMARKLFSKEYNRMKWEYEEEFPELPSQECHICYSKNGSTLITTPCNHSFCKGCLEQWIRTSDFSRVEVDGLGYEYIVNIQLNDNCPICRATFSPDFKMKLQ